MSIEREAALIAQRDELKRALIREQQRSARLAAKEADLVEAVYQAAKDAAVVVGQAAPITRPGRDRRRSPEVALLVLSDWQAGKLTPSYDLDRCEERIRLAARKTIKLAEIARADHPVRECVVALTGDLVEGVTVFPGQAHEVEASAFTQVFRVVALVEQVILTLLEAFERVTVYQVPGNHGRLGKRGDHPRRDNLDNIVYEIARERLDAQPRLEWHTNESWYAIVRVGSWSALLVHGDQVRSFGGNVPAFGIIRKAHGWQSGAIRERFNDVVLGHFHTPMQLPLASGGSVWVNGSPESDNEYAREFVAARGRPSQRLLFISPDRGHVTSSYTLWLDEE